MSAFQLDGDGFRYHNVLRCPKCRTALLDRKPNGLSVMYQNKGKDRDGITAYNPTYVRCCNIVLEVATGNRVTNVALRLFNDWEVDATG